MVKIINVFIASLGAETLSDFSGRSEWRKIHFFFLPYAIVVCRVRAYLGRSDGIPVLAYLYRCTGYVRPEILHTRYIYIVNNNIVPRAHPSRINDIYYYYFNLIFFLFIYLSFYFDANNPDAAGPAPVPGRHYGPGAVVW